MGEASVTSAKMKAAICKAANDIVVEDIDKPSPGPRELLIRVKAASLCHSDMSIVTGEWGDSFYPNVIGHEAVGVVDELGADAGSWGFQVGDAVGAPLWHAMCLSCADCKDAGPQFCPTMQIKGVSSPGYFAEFAVMDAASAVKIDTAAFETHIRELSPVFCAGITVWDALERARIAPGETVAIYGAGGLGQTAIRYASGLGARVVALDVRDEQLDAVGGPGGADAVINVRKFDSIALPKEVERLNGSLADAVIVTSGAIPAYQGAFSITKPMGRVIMVGLPAAPVPVVTQTITNKCISVIGAKVPGAKESKRCLDFTVRKSIYPKINPRHFKLEDLNEMVQLMKAGKVEDGRMVVAF